LESRKMAWKNWCGDYAASMHFVAARYDDKPLFENVGANDNEGPGCYAYFSGCEKEWWGLETNKWIKDTGNKPADKDTNKKSCLETRFKSLENYCGAGYIGMWFKGRSEADSEGVNVFTESSPEVQALSRDSGPESELQALSIDSESCTSNDSDRNQECRTSRSSSEEMTASRSVELEKEMVEEQAVIEQTIADQMTQIQLSDSEGGEILPDDSTGGDSDEMNGGDEMNGAANDETNLNSGGDETNFNDIDDLEEENLDGEENQNQMKKKSDEKNQNDKKSDNDKKSSNLLRIGLAVAGGSFLAIVLFVVLGSMSKNSDNFDNSNRNSDDALARRSALEKGALEKGSLQMASYQAGSGLVSGSVSGSTGAPSSLNSQSVGVMSVGVISKNVNDIIPGQKGKKNVASKGTRE